MKTSIAYGPQSPGTPNNLLPVSSSSGSGDGALTATTAMAYDHLGNLLTADGPLAGGGDTVTFRYDTARRNVGTVSPDPDDGGPRLRQAQRTTLTNGLVTKVERGTVTGTSDTAWAAFVPLEAVETGYDAEFRPATSKVTASGTTYALTQTGYDSRGRPECTAQRMDTADFGGTLPAACTLTSPAGPHGPDRIVKTVYNAANEVTEVRSAVGTALEAAETTSTFTGNGRAWTMTDGEGNKTTYEYDGHDRLAKTRFPSPTTDGVSSTTDYEQPTYDSAGNVTIFRNRAGETIAFTFDALNRPTLKDLPGSEPDVSFTYDLLGRMTGASQPGFALSFTYDALGRTLTQVSPLGTVSSTWDLAGRRTRLTHPDGFFVDHDYQPNSGDVLKIRENGATSGIGVLATFAYDDLGRRTSLTRGNGTVTSYVYDPVSRLQSLTQDLAGTANDLVLGFTYNPASQIVVNTRSNDLYAWTQHGSGTTSTTANGLNQLAGWNGTLSHDAKGNITAIGTSSYGYSSENLLTSAPGYTLTYDPLMRLQAVTGAITNRRVYDDDEMIVEYNAAGALARRIVHGPGVDEPLVWYGSGGTTRRFLHADERGSIVSATDVNGAPIVTYRYDEYGGWGTGNSGRYYYTGQTGYDELGLYYYKNRWRHPKLDRFMQTDRSGYDDGMNLYAYVKGDPVNRVDPTGDRGITNGERAMLKRVFGDLIDLDSINLWRDRGASTPYVVSGRVAYFSSDAYSSDFSRADTEIRTRSFWHEFYHMFEIQTGVVSWARLAWNIMVHGNDPELYTYDPNKSFMANNPEARAEYFEGCMVGGECTAMEGFTASTSAGATISFKNGVFRVTTRKTGYLAPHVRIIRPGAKGKGGDQKPAKPEKGKPKKK